MLIEELQFPKEKIQKQKICKKIPNVAGIITRGIILQCLFIEVWEHLAQHLHAHCNFVSGVKTCPLKT